MFTLPDFMPSSCDTVSAFAGRGKNTALMTWKRFLEVTAAFSQLLSMPTEDSNESMLLLERFIILMYD